MLQIGDARRIKRERILKKTEPVIKLEEPKSPPILTISNKVYFRKLQENERRRREAYHAPPVFDPYREWKLKDTLKPGTWSGHRCFVVGGGPSLEKFDFDSLAGELVIGVNRAFEKPNISINVSMDIQLFAEFELGTYGPECFKAWNEYRGLRLWRIRHDQPTFKFTPSDPDHPYVAHTVKPAHNLVWDNLERLHSGSNSGLLALNLALVLGADPIYLLGFDMKGRDKRQAWWHSGYIREQGDMVYKTFVKQFNRVAPEIRERGKSVINLNPKSRLTCFNFGNMEVLNNKVKRPMVLSFYTKGTGYEKEANNLKLTLHQFGMEYDIEGVDNFGSWHKNTHYKAKYILRKMKQRKKRDVLWLDADSLVCQYPEVFDDADFDLGVHIIDWVKYLPNRRDKQMANAVIYVKNTAKMRKFIQEWIDMNEKDPERIEMQTMQELAEEWIKGKKLKFKNLPATYCQIFDLMAKAGDPVIEQTQASRRLKDEVMDNIDSVTNRERAKYDNCWSTGYGRSQCAIPLVDYVKSNTKKNWKCLDLGCGDGTTVDRLREAGINCKGVDITLMGLGKRTGPEFSEAPLWELPFKDNQFDYTFSTDVLEHIPPEKVADTIREIYRVTKYKTFHVIAMFAGIRNGVILHMTLQKIEWWRKQFKRLNQNNIDTTIITRKEFMEGREVARPAG